MLKIQSYQQINVILSKSRAPWYPKDFNFLFCFIVLCTNLNCFTLWGDIPVVEAPSVNSKLIDKLKVRPHWKIKVQKL